MPIAAGAFDPVPASVYYQETDMSGAEPVQTTKLFCRTYIRFPYNARTGLELAVQHNMQSFGQIHIRARKDSKTKLIDPSMEIHHDGIVYGILTINPIPSIDRDEIEWLCQYKRDSSIVPTP